MQLDLFADGLVTRLRNTLIDALEQRDEPRAQAALTALQAEAPVDALLKPAETLIGHLTASAASTSAASPASPAAPARVCDAFAGTARSGPSPHAVVRGDAAQLIGARRHLEDEVAPAARVAFGERALPWLRPCWRTLAEQAATLPWDPAQADVHAAALWLQVGDATAAAAAVERIASWRRIPVPLGWMLQARCRSAGLDASWPLIAELCWLAPARLPGLVKAVADPLLGRLYRQFEDSFDEGPAWFPAWLLTAHPSLLPRLREAEAGLDTPAERGFRLLVALLGYERQGRQADAIDCRKRLRDLHPALFAACMAAR